MKEKDKTISLRLSNDDYIFLKKKYEIAINSGNDFNTFTHFIRYLIGSGLSEFYDCDLD